MSNGYPKNSKIRTQNKNKKNIMNKQSKIIITSVAALIAAAIVTGITLNTGDITPVTSIETPVATATETPALAETPLTDFSKGEKVMGFDEYNSLYTVNTPFNAGESTVATAGDIIKNCGSEPIAFERAVLSGYTVTYSDVAHTTAIDITCSFSAPTDAFEDAGFEGLE